LHCTVVQTAAQRSVELCSLATSASPQSTSTRVPGYSFQYPSGTRFLNTRKSEHYLSPSSKVNVNSKKNGVVSRDKAAVTTAIRAPFDAHSTAFRPRYDYSYTLRLNVMLCSTVFHF